MWKDVPEYEGYYMVNEDGQIMSVPRCVLCKDGKTKQVKQRILKPAKYRNGYLFILLCKGGTKKQRMIHRIVMEAFYGKSQLEVNHKDGNKANNALANLEYVTHSENQLHSYRVLKRKVVTPYKGKQGFEHNKSKPIIIENVITGDLCYYGSFRVAQEAGFCRQHLARLADTDRLYKGTYKIKTL